MLRSILSAVALAGIIAAAQPAFADAAAATAPEHAQPAAAAAQQSAPPAAASSPRSLDAPAPAGFGWAKGSETHFPQETKMSFVVVGFTYGVRFRCRLLASG